LLPIAVASCNNIKCLCNATNTVCRQCSNTNICRLFSVVATAAVAAVAAVAVSYSATVPEQKQNRFLTGAAGLR
jgi:hypothetical protein